MFTKARLKLTGIYLLIIMTVSMVFSAVIYRSVTQDLITRFRIMESRFEGRDFARQMRIHEILLDDLNTAQKNLFFTLFYTDLLILFVSAGAGFVMAGKTLKPIEEAMEEQKRFIADASHEIKTPLTAIKTNIEVHLRDKRLTLKEAKRVLEQNLIQVNELKNLTSGLLTMAKLDQYNEIDKKKTNISEIARSVINKLEILAKNKKIKINVDAADSYARVEQDSIEKLVTILIDNAIKYTDSGSIQVQVKDLKNFVSLKITDTGIGISKIDLPFIFDRFYRADTSRTRGRSSGYGLGLSLAKQIVEKHNGKITAYSKVGKGSSFEVNLPK